MSEFEQWWHEKCETDFNYPNESSFIRHIARESWNAAIDASASVCFDQEDGWEHSWSKVCKEEILKLKSE